MHLLNPAALSTDGDDSFDSVRRRMKGLTDFVDDMRPSWTIVQCDYFYLG